MSEQETSTTPNGATPAAEDKKQPEAKPAKRPKAEKSAPTHHFKAGESGFLTSAQRKHVVLVTDETDMLYNPKVEEPVPERMVENMTTLGWLPTNPLTIMPDGRIVSGRTKWRALPKAEKEKGSDIPVPYVVTSSDEEAGADQTDALDLMVQKLNPMVVAEKVLRALSRGKSPKEIFDLTGVSPEKQDGYLLITDEDKCPPAVQELLREDKISFAAALELARRADKLTKAQVVEEAERIAKMANAGVKVKSTHVKQEGDKVMTKKEQRQMVVDLGNPEQLDGKHAELIRYAAIIGLECGLGTRTEKSAYAALTNLAKGKVPKIAFKDYVSEKDDAAKPVKGQK